MRNRLTLLNVIPPTVDSVPRIALRRPEMAEALGVCERTLSSWADFPTVKINGTLLYPVDLANGYLAERARKGVAQ